MWVKGGGRRAGLMRGCRVQAVGGGAKETGYEGKEDKEKRILLEGIPYWDAGKIHEL